MKENYCHINVLIDRSGSMQSIKSDTIGGFNSFLKTQKEAPGYATFSLTQFDTALLFQYNFTDINEVKDLTGETFVPRGATALYDAIGYSIVSCGEKLAEMKESDRPEKVIFVIITDGEENASKEYKHSQIQEMIKEQSEKYSWEFVFLGANINAEETGSRLGIKSDMSMTFKANSDGVNNAFSSVSSGITTYRMSSRAQVLDAGYSFFSEDDKLKQENS